MGIISVKFTVMVAAICFAAGNTTGQDPEKIFLTLKTPSRENNIVKSSKNFITGLTCKECRIKINNTDVKVYNTGAFAHQILLDTGTTVFNVEAQNGKGKIFKSIIYSYTKPESQLPVSELKIESIQTFPEGDLVLRTGDKIRIKVKAQPGGTVTTFKGTQLHEMSSALNKGMTGIYQGEYTVQPGDNFSGIRFNIELQNPAGQKTSLETKNSFSVISPLASDIAKTKGRLAHLKYGLGEDRLGGAKIGYLDSLVLLKIIGKVGKDYKIQLAPDKTAYIEDDLVELMPRGTFSPSSLTSNWNIYGDSKFDYVEIGLTSRLPYQSVQLVNPSRIILDIFGATNNTNWITQLNNTKAIYNVEYEQVSDDIFRLTIHLKNKQHWGHQLYYKGNTLVLKIKQQPSNLELKDLTIAVDAGHGGSNTGAQGITGVIEKNLTLAVSLKLQQLLMNEGARVIMTRTTEKFFDNKERILFYRDSLPDLLVSIHLNSSADPVNVAGTMMFYRYPGFRTMNEFIYNRLLELDLAPGGITGSFNFMLNSPTEYPNALVETLFLSNPAEEARIVDPVFQQQLAEKIVLGLKDFLQSVK